MVASSRCGPGRTRRSRRVGGSRGSGRCARSPLRRRARRRRGFTRATCAVRSDIARDSCVRPAPPPPGRPRHLRCGSLEAYRLSGRPTVTATTPGLVCAHHHLYSALARGMPAPPQDADLLPGDPGAGLVAPRLRPRPGDDPLVGDARRPRGPGAGDHRHRGPPRVAPRHRGVARRHRRRLRRGGGAGAVRLRGHRPPRARRRPARPGGEPPLPEGGGPGPGGGPRRLHLPRRDAGGGGRAWPPISGWGCTSTWPRARATSPPPTDWPASPGTTGCWPTGCTCPTTTACAARSSTTPAPT